MLREYDQFGAVFLMVGIMDFTILKIPKRPCLAKKNYGVIVPTQSCPFYQRGGSAIFGCKNIEGNGLNRDLEAQYEYPRFERWQALRDTDESRLYIGFNPTKDFIARALSS